MLEKLNPEEILFLDIETVPQYASFDEAPESVRLLWEKKIQTIRNTESDSRDAMYHRAGIYAEFGKVICISCGYFTRDGRFRIGTFSGHDEKKILQDFASMLTAFCTSPRHQLCAHNGKEFDFPYLSRRLLIHGTALPAVLNTPGKKPWEVTHLDTMELWKFGDYKSYTSLALLANVMGVETPKDDIDGSQVGEVYWKDNDLQRIVTYCQKDVLTIAQIFRKWRGEELLNPGEIDITEKV